MNSSHTTAGVAPATPSDRALDLARTLVRMNTVSANSNLELIHFIRDELARLGVRSRLTFNAEKTKANLFATLGEGKPAGVILSGHTDTVPWDGQVWSADPLAAEVREEWSTKLSKNGGHLGPNLGVVELTIALHSVFSTPKDKFVWDVSHQSYVHKLFTGRKARFQSIRTTGGLNGFSLRTESEHDCYGAGHAGTALSAALGMCAARDQRKLAWCGGRTRRAQSHEDRGQRHRQLLVALFRPRQHIRRHRAG